MNQRINLSGRQFSNLSNVKHIPSNVLDIMKTRYATAVTKTNEIFEALGRADRSKSHPLFSEMRTLLAALPDTLATVKSYELFFSQLGSRRGVPQGGMAEHITRDFGSHTAFVDEFVATSVASRGWAAVVYDLDLRRLMCVIGDTPEQLTVWNTQPVIVLEVAERTIEPGSDRPAYIRTLIDHLDWTMVEKNLQDALGLQPAGKPF